MKKFNLEAAIAGSPVVTGDGRKVTDLHYFKDANLPFKLYACINGNVSSYYDDGKYTNMSSDKDNLFMYEPIVEGWMNLYKHNITGEMWTGDEFQSYETAVSCKDWECGDKSHYIKTIKIDNRL